MQHFSSVGTVENEEGHFFIFINGINNSKERSAESAKKISKIFNNQKIHYLHNPNRWDDFWPISHYHENSEKNISTFLAKKILEFLKKKVKYVRTEDLQIILFAHSHGAVIALKALEYIYQNIDKKSANLVRRIIKAYTFGGAAMIPDHLASDVNNFLTEKDHIHRIGKLLCNQYKNETDKYTITRLKGLVIPYDTFDFYKKDDLPIIVIFKILGSLIFSISLECIFNHPFQFYLKGIDNICKKFKDEKNKKTTCMINQLGKKRKLPTSDGTTSKKICFNN